MNITWSQAQGAHEEAKQQNQVEYDRLLKEINTSNPTVLSYSDFQYYAGALDDCNIRKEEYSANEVRRIMMDAYGCNSYDMINTFVGSDTDDIVDFY